MTTPKFRLAEAPVLVLNAPDCSVCEVTVDDSGDGWTCSNCGTFWAYDQGDGDAGELPEYDDPGLPLVQSEDAWKHAGEYARLAEAVDAAKVEPNPAEPYGRQCADTSEGFGISDIVAARDAARAVKVPTPDAPLVVSRHDADRIAGTPAGSGIVVNIQMTNPPILPPDLPRSWFSGLR